MKSALQDRAVPDKSMFTIEKLASLTSREGTFFSSYFTTGLPFFDHSPKFMMTATTLV
jgi:hypothetical protein